MFLKDLVEQIEETLILGSVNLRSILSAGVFSALVIVLIHKSNFDSALFTTLITLIGVSVGAVLIGFFLILQFDEKSFPVTRIFVMMAWHLGGYTLLLLVCTVTLFLGLKQLPFGLLFLLQACLGLIILAVTGIFALALKDVLIARHYEREKIQNNSSDE